MTAIDLSIRGNSSAFGGEFNYGQQNYMQYWSSNVSQYPHYYNYGPHQPIDLSSSQRHLDSNQSNEFRVNKGNFQSVELTDTKEEENTLTMTNSPEKEESGLGPQVKEQFSFDPQLKEQFAFSFESGIELTNIKKEENTRTIIHSQEKEDSTFNHQVKEESAFDPQLKEECTFDPQVMEESAFDTKVFNEKYPQNYWPNYPWQQSQIQKQKSFVNQNNFLNQNNFSLNQGSHYQNQNNFQLIQGSVHQNQSNLLSNENHIQQSLSGHGFTQQIQTTSQPSRWTHQVNQGLIQPNLVSQQNLYSSLWNNYSSKSQHGTELGRQYGWSPQSQQNGNQVNLNIDKNEFNNSFSNDETSDLGSSINTTRGSEDSFSFDNDYLKVSPTFKPKPLEQIKSWVSEDQTLPKGWKKKTASTGHGKFRLLFLSPTGIKFRNRIAAEDHLVKNPQFYSKADLEKFRINYKVHHNHKYEWVSDDNTLPKGWKKRKSNAGSGNFKTFFMTHQNEKFTNRMAVLAHLEANSHIYTETDIEKFKLNYLGHIANLNEWEWVSDDKTLPNGWKKKTSSAGNGRFKLSFLSPSNEIFSRRVDVQSYMENNPHIHTLSDIEKFKSNYMTSRTKVREYTNWDDMDPSLPAGWFKRQYDYVGSDGKRAIEYEYLSPDRQTFNSRNAIVAFMKTSNSYSESEIELVLSGRLTGRFIRRQKT